VWQAELTFYSHVTIQIKWRWNIHGYIHGYPYPRQPCLYNIIDSEQRGLGLRSYTSALRLRWPFFHWLRLRSVSFIDVVKMWICLSGWCSSSLSIIMPTPSSPQPASCGHRADISQHHAGSSFNFNTNLTTCGKS